MWLVIQRWSKMTRKAWCNYKQSTDKYASTSLSMGHRILSSFRKTYTTFPEIKSPPHDESTEMSESWTSKQVLSHSSISPQAVARNTLIQRSDGLFSRGLIFNKRTGKAHILLHWSPSFFLPGEGRWQDRERTSTWDRDAANSPWLPVRSDGEEDCTLMSRKLCSFGCSKQSLRMRWKERHWFEL